MNTGTDRRGEVLAILGSLACLAAFAVLLVVSLYGLSTAVYATAWLTLGMTGIWIVAYAQVHQQRLLAEERLEKEMLERERKERLGGSKTIFDETDLEQMEALAMGRRLRTLERWFVPIGALLVALFHAIMGIRLIPGPLAFSMVNAAETTPVKSDHLALLIAFVLGVTALTFFLSRYAVDLARIGGVPLVRAGGNAMFGVTIAGLATGVALLLTNAFDWPAVERWTARAIGGLMILLAAEIVINFVMDLYRPRIAGVVQRTFYDSRLLGMFSEPGGVLKSMADALDFQFGFKVSETWFFQLLGRWVVPLLMIQALVIWLLTSIVVVPPGYEAVVERFRPAGSNFLVMPPGVSVKAPWPIDRATLIAAERIRQLEIGYDKSQERPEDLARREPELWSVKHRKHEYGLIVPDRLAAADESLPLNLLSVTIPIQWRVKPGATLRFHEQSRDVDRIVEEQAYRVLTRFASSATVLDLLGEQGAAAAARIKSDLQTALDHGGYDGGDLGIEIVHVSLANVHPITEAADAYEETVNALQQKEAAIRKAEGEAHKKQVLAGGLHHDELFQAILAEERAAPDQREEARRETERLLRELAGGDTRQIIARAERQAFKRIMEEMSQAEMYAMQLTAYEKSPALYKLRRYLRTLDLSKVRTYILCISNPSRVVLQFDEEPAIRPELINATIQGMKGQ